MPRAPSLLRAIGGIAATLFAASVLVLVVTSGCGRQPPTAYAPVFEPDDIKQLVNQVKGKKQRLGMGIDDSRVAAAGTLAKVGPRAKEFGAVEALEKLAQDKEPKAKAAAQEALAQINRP